MSEELTDAVHDKEDFSNTRWTIVLAAGGNNSVDSKNALTKLCETYWYPLYVYARRRVSNRSDAEDMTQAFFAEFLEKNFVAAANPNRGRFRAFLLTSFKNFMGKQWEKSKALKRGGGNPPISLDFAGAETKFGEASIEVVTGPADWTAEQLFDRQWAITLLNRTLEQLEQEHSAANKEQLFQELKGFIIGNHAGTTYQDVAQSLGMTVAAAKMAASRMRARYQSILRAEIAQTVSENESIEDEIHALFAALAKK